LPILTEVLNVVTVPPDACGRSDQVYRWNRVRRHGPAQRVAGPEPARIQGPWIGTPQ
jgi:hypothetical protein